MKVERSKFVRGNKYYWIPYVYIKTCIDNCTCDTLCLMFAQFAPPLPKYFKLAEALREQIWSGQLVAGEQIASEPNLCAIHGLSRGTVRQAIQLLVDEGLLVRKQGLGTFVASPTARSQHFSLTSFDDEMRRTNRQPGTRLICNEVIPAQKKVAKRLAIPPKTPVYHIQRLQLADGQPVALETRYLARSLCPQLVDEDLENASLHWLFAHKYQIPLVRMEHVVEIQPVSAKAASLLQIPSDATVFYVDRLTFTTNEAGKKIPAVWFQAIYAQEQYAIQTQTL